MTAVPWRELGLGDLVLGGDGQEWTVEELGVGVLQLSRVSDAKVFRGVPRTDTIERLMTAQEVSERAVALTQVRLGGEVVATKDEVGGQADRGWAVAATWFDAASLAAHLFLFHAVGEGAPGMRRPGSKTEAATRTELLEIHDTLHREIESGHAPEGYRPHWHDETFWKRHNERHAA